MTTHSMVRRTTALVVLAGTLLIQGCSDDGDEATDTSDSPTTTAAPDTTLPSGSETTAAAPDTTAVPVVTDERAFKVMVIGDETATISFTVPEAVPAVQGALADLPNVEVLHCNSKGDSNAAVECERDAIAAGVAAVIVSFGAVGQDQTLLTEAGIPVLGGSSASAPTAFSISSGLGAYAALGAAAGAAECTKIGTLYLDGAEFLADMIEQGAALQDVEEVARSPIPQNTPDIAPQVAALTQSDADCIVLSVTPSQAIQAVTAINQSGTEAKMVAAGAVFPQHVIDELGDLTEGLVLAESSLSPADESPVIAEIKADMAAFDADASVTTIGILSWASAQLIIDALPLIEGDVTPEALLAALLSLENAPAGGAVHPVTAEVIDNPLFSHFFNPWALLYRITDGVPARITEDYFSTTEVLQQASMS